MPSDLTRTRQQTEIGEGLAVGCLIVGVTAISPTAALDDALVHALSSWPWAPRYPALPSGPRPSKRSSPRPTARRHQTPTELLQFVGEQAHPVELDERAQQIDLVGAGHLGAQLDPE